MPQPKTDVLPTTFLPTMPPHQRIPPPAENRTLCRARALGKRVSVFSPRARTPAGGRSRCVFAKQIRGFSAQCPGPEQMRCYRISAGHAPQQRRVRCAFPMAAQAESTSRNPRSDWDVVSGWRLKRKLRPGILIRIGMQFPNEWLAKSSSRNPASNWDALSAPSPQLQNLCALHLKTG